MNLLNSFCNSNDLRYSILFADAADVDDADVINNDNDDDDGDEDNDDQMNV